MLLANIFLVDAIIGILLTFETSILEGPRLFTILEKAQAGIPINVIILRVY